MLKPELSDFLAWKWLSSPNLRGSAIFDLPPIGWKPQKGGWKPQKGKGFDCQESRWHWAMRMAQFGLNHCCQENGHEISRSNDFGQLPEYPTWWQNLLDDQVFPRHSCENRNPPLMSSESGFLISQEWWAFGLNWVKAWSSRFRLSSLWALIITDLGES